MLWQFPQFWNHRGILSRLLLPFAILYQCGVTLRRSYYRWRTVRSLDCPVLVVGNVTVGGSGKTPLVIYLVEELKRLGYQPGVISRGYGRNRNSRVELVTSNSSASEVGDEPLLIFRRTGCPVAVAIDRRLAAEKIIRECPCNIIISDDGLQHYRLPRDLELLLVDGARGWGNGYCLPAGPLREPLSRVHQVDWVIEKLAGEIPRSTIPAAHFTFSLAPVVWRNLYHPQQQLALNHFCGRRVHAIAGIGNPSSFFGLLRRLELEVIAHPFPDHYQLTENDLRGLTGHPIVMTEKDAVKCQITAAADCWYLEIQAEVDPRLITAIHAALASRYPANAQ